MRHSAHRRARRAASLALLLCLVSGASRGGAAPGLRHDPFTRPGATGNSVPGAVAPLLGGAPGDAVAVVEVPWQPELRGVMLAGRASVANVGGTTLGLGESIDGWRLLQIEDGKAVFGRGGRRTTLTMSNPGQQKP